MKIFLIILIVAIAIIALILGFLIFKNKGTSSSDIPPQHPSNIEPGKLPERYPSVNSYQFISGKDHKTDMYKFVDNKIIVVRRGMPFTITNSRTDMKTISCKMEKLENEFRYRSKTNPTSTAANDKLRVKKPGQPDAEYSQTIPNGPYNVKFTGILDFCSSFTMIPLDTKNIKEVSRTSDSITFNTDTSSQIGHYRLTFGDGTVIELYIVFNPYSPLDDVYLPDLDKLDEYLLNDHGFIFKGTASKQDYNLIWDYSQFDEVCFLSIMALIGYLEGYDDYDGSDPASVSRNLTYGIGNNVLRGNWADNSATPNFGDVKCDTVDDCTPHYNLCQQPPSGGTQPNTYPKVCGYTYNGDKKTDTFLQDYMPLTHDDNYHTCATDDECKDIEINLPADYDPDKYDLKCINSKLCGYDVYTNPDENATSRYTSPYSWTSSRAIFSNYYNDVRGRTSHKICNRENSPCLGPVSFGQCWVFAALLNTACRTIGIPSRQICCYNSGHEYCNYLLPYPSSIIPINDCGQFPPYQGQNQATTQCEIGQGKFSGLMMTFPADEQNPQAITVNGSIWSFHNWNEVWFKRPKINNDKYKGFDWNIIDSTYQEISNGLSVCGPAPKKAVKENIKNVNSDIPYDVSFVSSEVNFANVNVTYDERQRKIIIPEDIPADVNTIVVTSKPGALINVANPNIKLKDIQEDLSDTYKHDKPALVSTTATMKNINLTLEGLNPVFTLDYLPDVSGPVKISIQGSFALYDGTVLNSAFSLNTSAQTIKNQRFQFQKQFELPSTKLQSSYILANINITFPDGQTYFDTKYLYLNFPDMLTVSMSNNKLEFNKPSKVYVSIKNPYSDKPLTNVVLNLYSKYLRIENNNVYVGNIKPNSSFNQSFNVIFETPVHSSVQKSVIQVSLTSDTLPETIHSSQIIYL